MKFNRRSFLKIAGALSLGAMTPRFLTNASSLTDSGENPNVIIVVFDALSAPHIPLYGYSRNTMPNLSSLAEKAIVYHHHYSSGNFTTTGTASLLTGVLPWTHRALTHNATVLEEFVKKNIFSEFSQYYRIAYSHNRYVNTFFRQFMDDIDKYVPREDLFLEDAQLFNFLKNDEDISAVGWNRALDQKDDGHSYSLYLSQMYSMFQEKIKRKLKEHRRRFPRGLPQIKGLEAYYLLEHSIDYWINALKEAPEPYLSYFHFLPPHNPYNTRVEFYNAFKGDDYSIPKKPAHIFSRTASDEMLNKLNTHYDEYILYVDNEFARFYKSLEEAGQLENTWLILTSDHGELFERGVSGHTTPMIHQPIMQIPLVIFEPGRNSRLDVYENTNAVDVLPTLLKLTGQNVPTWIEGKMLPPFSPSPDSGREIWGVHSIATNDNERITQGSVMLIIENYKLAYYFDYDELGESGELVELFDLKADPLELEDLYPTKKSISNEMLAIIKRKLKETNSTFLK